MQDIFRFHSRLSDEGNFEGFLREALPFDDGDPEFLGIPGFLRTTLRSALEGITTYRYVSPYNGPGLRLSGGTSPRIRRASDLAWPRVGGVLGRLASGLPVRVVAAVDGVGFPLVLEAALAVGTGPFVGLVADRFPRLGPERRESLAVWSGCSVRDVSYESSRKAADDFKGLLDGLPAETDEERQTGEILRLLGAEGSALVYAAAAESDAPVERYRSLADWRVPVVVIRRPPEIEEADVMHLPARRATEKVIEYLPSATVTEVEEIRLLEMDSSYRRAFLANLMMG